MKLNHYQTIIIGDQALKITYRRAPSKDLTTFLGEKADIDSMQAAAKSMSDKVSIDSEKFKEILAVGASMHDFSVGLLPTLIVSIDGAPAEDVDDILGDEVRMIINDLPDDVEPTIAVLVKKLVDLSSGASVKGADFQPELFEIDVSGGTKEILWRDMNTEERINCLTAYEELIDPMMSMVMTRDGHKLLSKSRRRRNTGGRRKS